MAQWRNQRRMRTSGSPKRRPESSQNVTRSSASREVRETPLQVASVPVQMCCISPLFPASAATARLETLDSLGVFGAVTLSFVPVDADPGDVHRGSFLCWTPPSSCHLVCFMDATNYSSSRLSVLRSSSRWSYWSCTTILCLPCGLLLSSAEPPPSAVAGTRLTAACAASGRPTASSASHGSFCSPFSLCPLLTSCVNSLGVKTLESRSAGIFKLEEVGSYKAGK